MRHESELLDEERLCEHALDQSTDGLAIVDGAGRMLHANRAVRDASELASALVKEALGGEGELAKFAAALRETGQAVAEKRVRDGKGAWRQLLLKGTRLAPDRFAIVARDVTERRKVEAELGQLRRVESLGYLTASVVHDFNNLLTPIVCLSAVLTHEVERGSRAGEMAGEIRETAERAAGLARQILSFLRRAPEPPVRLNVGAVVSEMRGLLRRVAGDEVELVVTVDEDSGDVMADREQLEQVLVNLTANARDAMPRGGRLFLSATPVTMVEKEAGEPVGNGTYVALRVSDTGVGMSPEVRARAFERFFTTKPPGEGSGLGLAAARRFAKMSGGCVSVTSAENVGTTVTICLPRLDDEASPVRPSSPTLLPRGSETVLVVEDDNAVRGVVRALLEAQGYRVLDAPSGKVALELVRRGDGPIDLLVTDVIMPEMSGPALVEALTAIGSSMRVLFMSGHSDGAIRERGVSCEARNLLRKAFSPTELIQRVREVLGPARAE